MKTLYIKQKDFESILRQFQINLTDLPSAGPHPSIKGMKANYYGKDALCVKSGTYVYLVNEEIYNRILED